MLFALLACTRPEPLPSNVTLTSDALSVDVSLAPFDLTVSDADGVKLHASDLGFAPVRETWTALFSPGWYGLEIHGDDWEDVGSATLLDADDDSATITYGGATMTVSLDGARVRVEADAADPDDTWGDIRFDAAPDEEFLGMGERFTRTAFRGSTIYSWCEEGGVGTGEGTDGLAPNGESMAYFPVPWVVSTEGYGVWLDTTYRTSIDFAESDPDAWSVEVGEPRVAFEVYVDDDPNALIDAFTARTGRPTLPAPWAFGPMRRIDPGDTQLGVSEIQAMRDEDLAITMADDARHFLPHLSQVGDEDMLAAWTASQHDLGYKAIGYYNGLVSAEREAAADIYEEGKEKGYFIKGPDGEPSLVFLLSGGGQDVAQVDFTNPDAVAWYQDMFDWALDLGYDGWMYDFGEYVQPDDTTYDGRGGREFHNENPVLYQKAGHDRMEERRPGDWFFFARSGYTGSNQYAPATWGGDPAASFESADGLPSMIRAGVNAGMSGTPFWGGDIGGYHCIVDGTPTIELIIRWIEQGALSPIMMDEDACSGGGTKPSIWDDPVAEDVWRTYARLHTRLFPYLWSLAQEAVRTGAPLMRHVYLEERDPTFAAEDSEHFLGHALLVAPVIEKGAVTREVRFPAGERYMDWDDGTVHSGTETVDAPLDKLPLYLRRGYLVPLLDPTIDTLAVETNPDVVGPTDVDGVLDVRGFLAPGDTATFDLVASSVHSAEGTLSVSIPAGTPAGPIAAEGTGTFTSDGITFTAPEGLRVRWDLVIDAP
jgi:alpha-glucosidase (family GH31 glycosyl hydrolase)